MQGEFIVSARPPAQTLAEADISREPTDLPPPIARHEPQLLRVDLIAEEVSGRLASVERALGGILYEEGPENPDIFTPVDDRQTEPH